MKPQKTRGYPYMELNKLKIELIRKLIDARLSPSERQEVLEKAKEIVEREKSTDNQPKNKK